MVVPLKDLQNNGFWNPRAYEQPSNHLDGPKAEKLSKDNF